MANEEVLGPRKTMFVLVIVVGCFAVLWPRILSPLMLGNSRDQIKPNQFDREAGCCEVLFESEIAVLELVNEVCSSAVGENGKLSPLAALECRKAVNETCGLDIAAFLKRSENVGKTTKTLVETMKNTNSSCLKEHFGVPVWSLNPHPALNSWTKIDLLKQERSPIRAGPHPALRERGRAIPAGAPTPPSRGPVPLPPHARPPPIPGMRPPLGSPGGPVQAPKSSMGFVMPIYTICIIVFFVYTLSKILFKRTGSLPYEQLSPDPQFRRRVFRDDSRSEPETKLVVTAISGLVAEVQQQMEASYAQSQQRQDVQDNQARPYTNGTVLTNNAPVRIIASEYREPFKDGSPDSNSVKETIIEEKEPTPEPKERTPEPKQPSPEPKEASPEPKEASPEPKEASPEPKEASPEPKKATPEPKETSPEPKEASLEPKEETPEPKEATPDLNEIAPEPKEATPEPKEISLKPNEIEQKEIELKEAIDDEKLSDKESSPEAMDSEMPELLKLTEDIVRDKDNVLTDSTIEFLRDASEENKQETEEEPVEESGDLLNEALKDDSSQEEEEVGENASVKVMGMETRAHAADGGVCPAPLPPASAQTTPRPTHEAEEVKSIYLETEIPQQSRVLVANFAEDRTAEAKPSKHSPSVVSGKMTLSLIQDAPRDTPDRELDSTVDEYTTASAVTQPAAEKGDDLSDDEEIDEEIEVEEIEEEVEEEEEEQPKQKKVSS